MTNTARRYVSFGSMLSLILLLAACAAPTALTSKTKQLDLGQKSIVLASIELTREGNRTMPWPTRLQILPAGSTDSREIQSFSVDTEGMDYGDDGRHYVALLRLSLAPGKYSLAGLSGEVSMFPFRGAFSAPLGLVFEVPPQSVVYLGRVNIHMRTRRDNEFRAGPLFPLISQAALGISDSTFDIATADRAASDLVLFKENFPVLRTSDVRLQRLPEFRRDSIDRAFMGTKDPEQEVKPAGADSTAKP